MTPAGSVRPSSDRLEDTLRRNLDALDRVDPELAERLRLPTDDSAARYSPDGILELRIHRSWVSLAVDGRELERSLEYVADARSLLVLGIGGGEVLERLLGDSRNIVAWERDPWILRAFLSRNDVTESVSSGRLRLSLGTDLLSRVTPKGGREDRTVGVVEHPLLSKLYGSELRTLRRRAIGLRVVMCAGGLFVEEVRRAFELRGSSVWTLDIERYAEEELARSVACFCPEVVFAINYTAGLAEFCEKHGVRLIVWEIDASTTPPEPLTGDAGRVHIFTFRRANVDLYRRAGFVHVEYLPLAADTDLRRPLDGGARENESGALVAHVGSSLVENALACRTRLLEAWTIWAKRKGEDPHEIPARLGEILADQRVDASRFRIPELLEFKAPGFRAETLATIGREDPNILAGEIAASEKRVSWAANLGRFGLAVWGDDGWRVTERYGVRYRGPAAHRTEVTEIYNSIPLHWDVGRIYQPDIVTMRVFDVLACGRLVIAEYSPALAELFELGIEVESYRDLNELQAKLTHYAANPREADRVAARGREAVVRRHSIEARVTHMLAGAG